MECHVLEMEQAFHVPRISVGAAQCFQSHCAVPRMLQIKSGMGWNVGYGLWVISYILCLGGATEKCILYN